MKPENQKLYDEVKRLANVKFDVKTSAYKSSWIVREYKKRGGTYKGKKPSKTGLSRWYKEKWVDLRRPIKKGRKIIGYEKCGRTKKESKYPLCRPLRRITEDTPKTVKEISPKVIEKLLKKKTKYTRVRFT